MTEYHLRTVQQKTLRLLLASTAFVAVGSLGALAQSTTTAAPAASSPADSTAVGEVVVTAQRRVENVQDVPITVDVISGAAVKNADIVDATRLEQVVPGLRIGRSGTATRPSMRGVYTEAIQNNADPRIGFYIDDIYQSRTQQGDAAFVDLDRVEVQKGPQGTLYGRNSLGGNIAIHSAVPTHEFGGGAEGILGNYDREQADGYLNIPIMDGLDTRIAGYFDRHDGYLKSSVTPAADLDDKNEAFVRGSIHWVPPQLGGKLDVLGRVSYFQERDHGNGSFNGKTIGSLVDPSLITKPGGTITYNGVNYPVPAGYSGSNYYTGTVYPFTTAFRDNIPDVGGADIGIPIGGPYSAPYDFPAYQRTYSTNYSLTASYDLNRYMRLRSITGYADFKTTDGAEGDGGPINYSQFYFVTAAKTFTQEIQIQSPDSHSPLQYTVGAFYMNDDDHEVGMTSYSHSYTTATAAATNQAVLYGGGGTCGFTYLPNITSTGTPGSPSCLLNNLNSAETPAPAHAITDSLAAYAQVSYTVANRLTLTIGARYTDDRKTYRSLAQPGASGNPPTEFVGGYVAAQNAAYIAAHPGAPQSSLPFPNDAALKGAYVAGTGYHAEFPLGSSLLDFNQSCTGVTPGTFAAAGSNAVVGTVPDYFATRCGQRSFKFATYHAAAEYKITPENNVYFSFSTGKHSGGFGASYLTTTSPQGIFGTYGPESIVAYEVGSKNRFFDNRVQLNVDAFYNEISNYQIQGLQYIPAIPGSITTIFNGPKEIAPGFDVELIAKPFSKLTISGSVSYEHARLGVFGNPIYAGGLCTISPTSNAASPCYIPASSDPNYQNDLKSYYASVGGLGSGFFPNPLTNPNLFTVASTNAAGTPNSYFSLINGKKTELQNLPDWSATFGASYVFDIGGYGRITPEFQTLYSGSYLLSTSIPLFRQKAYFKTDARITWTSEGGHFTAQAFVENLENKATIDRATTSAEAVAGTYAPPRTFGVKLGFHY